MKNLRERAGGDRVSHCNCLREVTAGGARAVRAVNMQVIDFIAGGETHFAAVRALILRITRRRLLGRRAGYVITGAAA